MATEAATGQPANIQAYLDKHKISTLFEDLTSLLVKDLPENPVDFLIAQLQAKKKKIASSVSKTAIGAKSATTGSKTAKPTGTKSIPRPSSGKSTSSTTSTVGSSAAAASGGKRLSSTRPTTAPAVKSTGSSTKLVPAGTKKTSLAVKSTASGIKKPSAGTAPAPTKSIPPAKATPTGKPPSKLPTPGTTPPRKPTSTAPPKGSGGTPTKGTKSLKKPGGSSLGGSPSTARKAQAVAKTTGLPKADEIKSDVISEAPVDNKDEEEEEHIVAMAATSSKNVEESDSEESEVDEEETTDSLALQDLISQIKRAKHPHKRGNGKIHIASLVRPLALATSEGYVSDSEGEDEEEEQLEVVENIDDLEEEGVYLSGEARRMSLKLPTARPSIDLKVQVCARCAKVLSRDEASTVVSSSLASKLTSIDEFESASQITSGQESSFPQWESDGPMTIKQKWSLPNIGSVISSSDDTWNGVAPPIRPEVPPSDEESELKLPAPVDYHKPDDEDTTVTSEVLVDIED